MAEKNNEVNGEKSISKIGQLFNRHPLPYRIARRYLFARRSINVINIISGISVVGIAIGTAALILILSVFNGFEDLISTLFSTFNPDVKITPAQGKTFEKDSLLFKDLLSIDGVEALSGSIEEIAFFEYKNIQDFGIIKGVDRQFTDVVPVDSAVIEGRFNTLFEDEPLAILGAGLRQKLSVNVHDRFERLQVYMPKRKGASVGLNKPYVSKLLQPVATFYIQQDFDGEYVLTDLHTVQTLLDKPGELSAIEIKVRNEGELYATKTAIRDKLGTGFIVRDRREQDEAFLKVMRVEKWTAFTILAFTLVLVAFNMIGSLWMIVIDKKQDISILKVMGADRRMIRNIFLWEGFLLCALGLFIGLVIAFSLYAAQKVFGIVSIPTGFIIDAYPISLRWSDLLAVIGLVLSIGLVASIPAAIRAANTTVDQRSA